MAGIKKENSYQRLVNPGLYAVVPKAVLAALVASVVVNGGADVSETDTPDTYIWREWELLHKQGIVPQPPKRY